MTPFLADGRLVVVVAPCAVNYIASLLLHQLPAASVQPLRAADILATVWLGNAPARVCFLASLLEHPRLCIGAPPSGYVTACPQDLMQTLQAQVIRLPAWQRDQADR